MSKQSAQSDKLGKLNAFTISSKELKLEKQLGKGWSAVVHSSFWKGRRVAVKKFSIPNTEKEFEDIVDEAKIMLRARESKSSYLMSLEGICIEPELKFYAIVMEFMPNSLDKFLKQQINQQVPWLIRYQIACDISHGLLQLHQFGLLHRDLKSLNILLSASLRAKLADFGIAKEKDILQTVCKTGNMLKGSEPWMAPELFKKGGQWSEQAEIFSLGMVLLELVTCKMPVRDCKFDDDVQGYIFTDAKIPDVYPKQAEPLISLIKDCQKERGQRPKLSKIITELTSLLTAEQKHQSSSAFVAEIEQKETVIEQKTSSSEQKIPHPNYPKRIKIALVVLVCVVMVLVLVILSPEQTPLLQILFKFLDSIMPPKPNPIIPKPPDPIPIRNQSILDFMCIAENLPSFPSSSRVTSPVETQCIVNNINSTSVFCEIIFPFPPDLTITKLENQCPLNETIGSSMCIAETPREFQSRSTITSLEKTQCIVNKTSIFTSISENPEIFLRKLRAQLELQDQLVTACEQGNDKTVLKLLEKGAKPNFANKAGKRPLCAGVWGMNPKVVTLIKRKGGVDSITWEECEKHNLKHYKEVFIVSKFAPETYLEWYRLLEKMELSPFIQHHHLKLADQSLQDSDSSSWENWKKFVKRAGGKSTRGCTLFWSGGVNSKCTSETESVYKGFREEIKQQLEARSATMLRSGF